MKKIIIVTLGLVLTVSAHAGLYRWVDDAGNVHFSDKMPVAASQKLHSKLNKSGDVTDQVDPELMKKKQELKKSAEREKQQLAIIQREKAKAHAILKKKDDNLLSTYSDENELTNFFEAKIRLVEGNNNILNAHQTVLKNKIVKLENRASSTKQKNTLENIAKKIVNIKNTLKKYEKAVTENDEQIIKLSENYHNDLTRFKELTN